MSLSIRKKVRGELLPMFLIIVGVLAFRSSFADHYYVPSGSMEPTLVSGDRVLVDKSAYAVRIPFSQIEIARTANVQRGDVVMFDSPLDGTRLIKRVVAIGGDDVAIDDGHLSIDGVETARHMRSLELVGDKLVSLNLASGGGPDLSRQIVPAGMLLTVGDHRGNSLDGRFFGFVPETEVYGKALGVYRRRGEGFVWRTL